MTAHRGLGQDPASVPFSTGPRDAPGGRDRRVEGAPSTTRLLLGIATAARVMLGVVSFDGTARWVAAGASA
jgi:hypothetical protein